MFKKSLLSLALFSAIGLSQASVLTTIKPLGFIANAITDGITETRVLLPSSASPHDYSLKPSDVEQLKSAELVVWIGEEMESFLEKSIDSLPKNQVLTLEEVEEIHEFVEAAAEKAKKTHTETKGKHAHGHDHHHGHKHQHDHKHAHGHAHEHEEDWHIWLSPVMAEHIAEQIAARLSELKPAQQAKIAENLAQFKTTLHAKHTDIQAQLAPHQQAGYYTFHDAYGYFETAYGLNSLGAFTINPTVAPGAKTLAKIKHSLTEKQASCLFAEPQFTPKVMESLSKGTNAKVGQLDPLGANIALSKAAYPQFLQQLADQFSQCLAR